LNLLEICCHFRQTTAIVGGRVSTAACFSLSILQEKRKHVDDQTHNARLLTGKDTAEGRVARRDEKSKQMTQLYSSIQA